MNDHMQKEVSFDSKGNIVAIEDIKCIVINHHEVFPLSKDSSIFICTFDTFILFPYKFYLFYVLFVENYSALFSLLSTLIMGKLLLPLSERKRSFPMAK